MIVQINCTGYRTCWNIRAFLYMCSNVDVHDLSVPQMLSQRLLKKVTQNIILVSQS